MALIYGGVSSTSVMKCVDIISELRDCLLQKELIHYEIKLDGFWGGVLFHSNLPYKLEDFVFHDLNKSVLVLVSGSIFNKNELIDILGENSFQLSNPKLILCAFEKWGVEFVNKLNGDFTILIFETKRKKTFLYRDHLGISPISFTLLHKSLLFSSDMLILSKILFSNEKIETEFLFQDFLSLYDFENYTQLPNNKLKKLLPGHYLIFDEHEYKIKKYWFPENIGLNKSLGFNKAIKDLNLILKDSVKIRCDKNFTASSHVSGGLDSGIIAALSRNEYINQKIFLGFSWSPMSLDVKDNSYDERELVDITCKHLQIKPSYLSFDIKDYLKYISNWRSFSDYYEEYKILKTAKLNRVNLIFSGWGGDEFISINDRGIDSDLLFNLNLNSFFKRNPIYKTRKLLSVLLKKIFYPSIGKGYITNKKDLNRKLQYFNIIKKDILLKNNTLYRWKSRREVHLRLLYNYHLSQRAEDWSLMGAYMGVEYRYPLLDKRIIEYLLQVPSKALIGKSYNRVLLRTISQDFLPNQVVHHLSKIDPIRTNMRRELINKTFNILVNDIDNFRSNPYLNFVHFDKLYSDIRNDIDSKKKTEINKFKWILISIKKMHELTLHFYDPLKLKQNNKDDIY